MKESKKALRRWKSQCKFEKRIRIWVPAGKSQRFIIENHKLELISSADLRNKIREGEYWNFLKWTSTPCSCSMCSGEKYKRASKGERDKQIWDDMALSFNGQDSRFLNEEFQFDSE